MLVLKIGSAEQISIVRELWIKVYIASIQNGCTSEEANCAANRAVDHFNQEWAR